MKSVVVFFVCLLFAILAASCTQTPAAPALEDVLTYSAECSETIAAADITYMSDSNEVVRLTDQSLPWSLVLDLSSADFNNYAYLKVEVPKESFFSFYIDGVTNSTGHAYKKLFDDDVDFVSGGVQAGDCVYNDFDSEEYSIIEEVSTHCLSLEKDLFTSDSMDYYIFREKSLAVSIDYNGEILAEDEADTQKMLYALVKSTVPR